MDTNKITQMIRIAKMHYELNRTPVSYTHLDVYKRQELPDTQFQAIL